MIKHADLPLLPLVGLCAYFIASIFYVFPSGTPQPADYLLLATISLTILFAGRRLPRDRQLYSAAGLFIGWIVIVNVTWFLITNEHRFLIVITFYLFNMLVFLFVIAVANHDFRRLRGFVWWACIAVLLLQMATLYLFPAEETSRAIGTFNNPNQLGYCALLIMACIAVIKHRTPLNIWDVAALSVGLYAIVLSASRAASISAVLLLALIIFYCRFEKLASRAAIGVLIVGLLLAVFGAGSISYLTEGTPVANLLERFEARKPTDDLASRGYERLLAHPEYLVFGAGEGEKDRFTEPDEPREFHSSLGNLLFSYGLVGLGLFGFLLFAALRSAPWPSIAYFGPVMLYGLSHMGLRFSLLWVLLGLVYAQGRYRLHRAAEQPGKVRPRTRKRFKFGLRPTPVASPTHVARADSGEKAGRSQRSRKAFAFETSGAASAGAERTSSRSSRQAPIRRGWRTRQKRR